MKTYFTSDSHFAHDGVLQMSNRPFSSIEEHDDHLIEMINRKVGVNDRLFHLGDFAFRAEESYARKIRCQNIHFIRGNHDKAKVDRLFKTAEDTTVIKLPLKDGTSIKVFLSHYPHAYYPASHYGSLHLYGHCHGQREETLDALFPGRRAMDVGVDVAKLVLGEYEPFSDDEILELLGGRRGHDDVDFYQQYQNARRAAPAEPEDIDLHGHVNQW